MMQQWRKATPAQLNLLQTVVDFATMLKNPGWLDEMKSAAKEIADINKLTDEEVRRLEQAGEQIAQAQADMAAVEKARTELDATIAAVEKRSQAVAKREQENDLRERTLQDRENKVLDRENAVTSREHEVAGMLKGHREDVEAFEKRQQREHKILAARTDEVTRMERKARAAMDILSGEGGGD